MEGRWWARSAGAVAAVTCAITACASESDTSLVLDGTWARVEVWEQRQSFDYDQVAAGNSPDTVVWVNRSESSPGQLTYWEMRDGDDPVDLELPTPDGTLVIPVGVATDDQGWAAVAVTRDQPNGVNTGLLAWQARTIAGGEVAAAQPLTPPSGVTGPPESVGAARSAGTVIVAALYDGTPIVWSRQAGDEDGDAWRSDADGVDLDLGSGTGLVSLRVVGDGERLVMAGVDDAATPHLWTSDDGSRWDEVTGGLPEGAGAVGLLTPVEPGSVAVAWLDDQETAPWNATKATIQRLSGDDLTDEGAVHASPDDGIERLHLTGATTSPDERLLVVGGVARSDGDRTPMVWVAEGDDWKPTEQESLTGHLDHEFRAVVTTDDDRMVAVATALSHPDVEAWHWRPGD